MKRTLSVAALGGLFALGLLSCSTKVNGQLMLAIETDMALPKDIDRVRIEVMYVTTGAFAYQKDFERVGEQDSIKLPATLGFIAPKDGSEAIKIRVIASRGSDESVRVLREIVTTVPTDRTATLPISIEFLCDGSAQPERDATGKVKRDSSGNVIVTSSCPEGLTCVAGTCTPSKVASAELLDYDTKEIFGGGSGKGDGTCFDTGRCFAASSAAPLDLETFAADKQTCRAKASGEINVGLRTQGGGICGESGCYVALDAGSDSGWKPGTDGWITLPSAVCEKAVSGDIVGVVTAAVSADPCRKKDRSIPTCGPWSASGKDVYTPPDPRTPVQLTAGKSSPTSLALSKTDVYWTSRVSFDDQQRPKSDGTVKFAPKAGGEPALIAGAQATPQGILFDEMRQFALWTNELGGEIMAFSPVKEPAGAAPAKPLRSGLLQPGGLSLSSATVYFTEVASNKVYKLDTALNGEDLDVAMAAAPVELAPPDPPGTAPRGLAAAKDAVCWTYEDELANSGGVVACSLANKTVAIATGQKTPQTIALRVDGMGSATAVYWANFGDVSTDPLVVGGGIFAAELPTGARSQVASVDYPAGLAVDADGTLYFTSRTGGTVMRIAPGETQPTVLVKDQPNPSAIAIDADTIYWINAGKDAEGGAPASDGAIMKAAK
jgi:sugar lactone lactonase YvrE